MKGPSLLQAGVLLYSLLGSSLLALSRGNPFACSRAPGPGTPCRIWALCWCPSQCSLEAMLAQCPLCGLPLVPPGGLRDQLQVINFPSNYGFRAMCSKTTKLCNLSWREFCASGGHLFSQQASLRACCTAGTKKEAQICSGCLELAQ